MSKTKTIAPFGTWTSPITRDIVSGSNLQFKEVHVDQDTRCIYLVESRPSEKGRCAIVELSVDGGSTDRLPQEYNARSKIHEYGGGAVSMSSNGHIIFTDSETGGVFRLAPARGITEEIIKGDMNFRYGDFDPNKSETHFIIAIQEEHREKEVINTIVVLNAESKKAEIVVEGADFYSHPKFSYDGKKLSWIQWNHPDMPWTGTELYVADWKDGKVENVVKVAGQARDESINQPKWHFDGTLLFSSDISGFWQLYQYNPKTNKSEQLLLKGYEETEMAGGEFIIGTCTFVPLTEDLLVVTFTRNAITGLILYDIKNKTATELPTGLVKIQNNAVRRVSDTQFVVNSGTTNAPIGIYLIDITKPSEKKLLKSSSSVDLPTSIYSTGRAISFPRKYGDAIGTFSHAIFIPPHNPSFAAPENSKPPPLIVWEHGGPTGHESPSLSLKAQYFTSRGYAYCLVNYAGSTGYGRKYREQLDYNWGLKDCEDTVSCIEYLASQGLVDENKVGITGGSAGGYTVLQGMCSFPTSFSAGCSLYGIGNLKSLAADTHKFESHYLFKLLFPSDTSEDEKEKIYYERSPCFHAQKIERPLVLLQGDIDRVVPMEQAKEMEAILKGQGKDVQLVVFEGEGHGFVRQENIMRALEEEEKLWSRTLL